MSEYSHLLNTTWIIILIESILLIVFIWWQVVSSMKIRKLKEALEYEEKKRVFPLFTLNMSDEKPGLFLRNDSFCHATNIVIKDMPIVIDLGFKKTLLLKFESFEFLKPGEEAKLTFKIFDQGVEDRYTKNDQLLCYFSNAKFDMEIEYSNIEDVGFQETISIENKKFYIKEAKARS